MYKLMFSIDLFAIRSFVFVIKDLAELGLGISGRINLVVLTLLDEGDLFDLYIF